MNAAFVKVKPVLATRLQTGFDGVFSSKNDSPRRVFLSPGKGHKERLGVTACSITWLGWYLPEYIHLSTNST